MNTEKIEEKAAETTEKEQAEEIVVITDPQLAVPDVALNDLAPFFRKMCSNMFRACLKNTNNCSILTKL